MAVLTKHDIKLEPHQVVLRPVLTEKTNHISERLNTYSFEVHPLATKEDVRHAVETLWNVKVVGVRTQTRVGKPRRTKTGMTHTQSWKKAIVKLHDEYRISLY